MKKLSVIAGILLLASCATSDPVGPSVSASNDNVAHADVLARHPTHVVAPQMPPLAVAARRSGYVDLAFTVEADGSVSNVQVVAEVPEHFGYAHAATSVFGSWKFQPKILDGKPVPSAAKYRMSFKITG
jgi:periplasmic protein TonB